MAVVAGTVDRAHSFNKTAGPLASITNTTEQEVSTCVVDVRWIAGTYASADDANFNPATAIQDSLRNGKSITVIGACGAGHGDENGAIIHAGLVSSITTNTAVLTLLQEDAATERADGAMSATWNRPVQIVVYFRMDMD